MPLLKLGAPQILVARINWMHQEKIGRELGEGRKSGDYGRQIHPIHNYI